MLLTKGRRFLAENGFYVLLATAIDSLLGRLRNRMLAKKLRVSKISIGPNSFIRGLSFVEMGEDVSAGSGFWLEAISHYHGQTFSPTIIIGKHVRISQWTHIGATHYVEIGDHVLIGSNVIITDHNHGQYSGVPSAPEVPPALRPLDREGKVVIGPCVWLGDGVVVLPGTTIGEGCVIGANSVVKGIIPPFTIAAGAPARPLKVYDFTRKEWIKSE